MIPKECKRLAEVDFPIAVVSKHAAREKSIRHGHPSTLHLWWARRPLAACRSMLMALLLPDPADSHCPAEFKREARRLLLALPGRPSRWVEEVKSDEGLRKCLLEFIGDFADWDRSADQGYLKCARGLVKAAHPDETPLVVDPFAGGGAIPLEALRIGCEAFACDLNPVACLILKVMIEDIPRHGSQLAEELRRVGAEVRRQAESELAEFYPPDADGAKPIAYLWARTIRCESPNCGAEIPLVRSFWLCKKHSRNRALRYVVVRPKGKPPWLKFEIFEPTSEDDLPKGTVNRAKATCPCCNITISPERVRAQLSEQNGGADVSFDHAGERIGGATLLAVVALRLGEPGRHYRLATDADYASLARAQRRLRQIVDEWKQLAQQGLSPVPNDATPVGGGSGAGRAFSLQKYGMMRWADLFSARQCLALLVLSRTAMRKGNRAAALAIGKLVDLCNSLCTWIPEVECPSAVFKLGRVKTGWDFIESAPFRDSSGSFSVCVDNLIAGVLSCVSVDVAGQSSQEKAQKCALPTDAAAVWFTDPPYYDAIPYADLADFFLVWLQRAVPADSLVLKPFEPGNSLSPKCPEIVQDEAKRTPDGRSKDKEFFENEMGIAFAEGHRVLRDDGIGSVVFAHKTTEGWEALLSGMIRGGWTITGSWPIATEMGHRIRARESAALATSVHLVCRPRVDDAAVGDWGEVLRELPARVRDWMERLQEEGIRGADLVFACIGPALEIFSRYSKVETAEGREVGLPEYLEKVWEVVGRTALEQVLGTAEAKARNGAALPDRQAGGALEEDARLTALFLWTLQSTNVEAATNGNGAEDGDDADDADDDDEESGSRKSPKGYSLIYDVVRRFAQPLGIHLEDWNGRIIETKKGVVRLLSVSERAKQLFGEDGASAVADRIESDARAARSAQLMLFPEADLPAGRQGPPPKVRGRGRRGASAGRSGSGGTVSDESLRTRRDPPAGRAGATTLDRVHAAMLLQASGRANALRTLLAAEKDRGPDFLRLSNALSALYPHDSEEKRLLDAMLLAVPR